MSNQNNSMWTPELVDRLRQLWPDHSASQISKLFESDGHAMTRSAVIGKSQRLVLSAKAFTNVSREEQRRKKNIREAGYKAAKRQAAVVLRTTGKLSQSRARRLEPLSKSELRAMFAQAVLNTIAA